MRPARKAYLLSNICIRFIICIFCFYILEIDFDITVPNILSLGVGLSWILVRNNITKSMSCSRKKQVGKEVFLLKKFLMKKLESL